MADHLFYQNKDTKFEVCENNPWGYVNANIQATFGEAMVHTLLCDMQSSKKHLRLNALEAFTNLGAVELQEIDQILYSDSESLQSAIISTMEFADPQTKRYLLRLVSNYSQYEHQNWGLYTKDNGFFCKWVDYFMIDDVDSHSYSSIMYILGNWAIEACESDNYWEFMSYSAELLEFLFSKLVHRLHELNGATNESKSEVEDDDVKLMFDVEPKSLLVRDGLGSDDTVLNIIDVLEEFTWTVRNYLSSRYCHNEYTRDIVCRFVELLTNCCFINEPVIYDNVMKGVTKFFHIRHLPKEKLKTSISDIMTPFTQDWSLKLKIYALRTLLFIFTRWTRRKNYPLSDVFTNEQWQSILQTSPANVLKAQGKPVRQQLMLLGTVLMLKYYYWSTKTIVNGGLEYALQILQTGVFGVKADTIGFLCAIAIKGIDSDCKILQQNNVCDILKSAMNKYNDKVDAAIIQALPKLNIE